MLSGTGFWKRDLDFQTMNKRTYLGAEEQEKKVQSEVGETLAGNLYNLLDYLSKKNTDNIVKDIVSIFLFSLYLQARFQGSKQADIQDSRYICRLEQISL